MAGPANPSTYSAPRPQLSAPDAHYNLACRLESLGDPRGALRHLSRFRRLVQND